MKKVLYCSFLLFCLNFTILSQSWVQNVSNIGRVYCMAVNPVDQNIIYAAGLDSGVYKSTNAGSTWVRMANGMTYAKVQCIAVSPANPNFIMVGTDQNGSTNSGIYRSTNAGTSWILSNTGIQETSIGIQSIVYHPTNSLTAWMCVFDGVAVSTVGMYKTTDGGATWFASNTGIGTVKNILSLAVNPLNGNVVYCGTSFVTSGTDFPKIYKSFNGGATWNDFSTGLPSSGTASNPIRTLNVSSVDTSLLIAGTFCNDTTGGMYFSTNGGNSWAKRWPAALSTAGTLIRSAAIRPLGNMEVFAGLDRTAGGTDLSVWRSTNQGSTWTQFISGAMTNSLTIRSLVFRDVNGAQTLFAGAAATAINGVYSYAFPAVPVELISFTASSYEGKVQLNWVTATETNNSGFTVQRNEGNDWNDVGFIKGAGTSTEMHSYSFIDNPSSGNLIYRLKQVDYDGSINYSKELKIALDFNSLSYQLSQNYPNPFNPSTTFKISLAERSNVRIIIYDVLGNEVQTLLNESRDKGTYEIRFNASALPSGIYLCKMTSGKFTQTRKLTLIK